MDRLLAKGVLLFFLMSGIGLSITSCAERPPDTLTRSQRTQVDTLFSRMVGELREETDSLCEVMMKTQMQAAVDSILKMRRAEEARIRERLKKRKTQE